MDKKTRLCGELAQCVLSDAADEDVRKFAAAIYLFCEDQRLAARKAPAKWGPDYDEA